MPLAQPTRVAPLPGYRLELTFDDGVSGIVDLSHLAGKGVFRIWDEQGSFESVQIGPSGELRWNDDVDLCSDALYATIAGRLPDGSSTSIADHA